MVLAGANAMGATRLPTTVNAMGAPRLPMEFPGMDIKQSGSGNRFNAMVAHGDLWHANGFLNRGAGQRIFGPKP